MREKTIYTCSKCGKVHEEWPALAFDSPTSYNVLPESVKQEIGELTGDFCTVQHSEQTDRFIRGTLTIKVNDHCENLEYGVWVSLSPESYQDYSEHFRKPHHQARYFGWLSNDIPEYEMPEGGIPTTVFTRQNGLRPQIVPHERFGHQLVCDYYEGISRAEAEKRISEMLIVVSQRNRDNAPSKPWWKIW